MISAADLRAAVGSGLLSEAQAARLTRLAAARSGALANARAGEEPFELFRGFNEIFIVVGLGILGTGWLGVWALIAGNRNGFGPVWTIAGLATAALLLLLSEYFIRRRRMIAPAIALSAAWTVLAFWYWATRFDSFSLLGGLNPDRVVFAMALTTASVALYWWRYRVPFAMALLAAAGFGLVISALGALSGQAATLGELFLLSGSGPFAWGTLIFGLGLFAAAMRLDMGDPHRVTLRASNAFWLHVVAAPAIVNTLAVTLLRSEGAMAMPILAVLLAVIAAIAVVIDRRSFLVSAVGYTVALITQTSGGAEAGAIAVLLLGAGLVGLGAGWNRVRARLLRPVPPALRDRLPPGMPAPEA